MLWLKETSTYPQLNSQDRQQRLKGAMVSALRGRAALGAEATAQGKHVRWSSTVTCTGGAVWGRPRCSGSIWETWERRDSAVGRSEKAEMVSHEVLVMVVGQDFGDIPVSGGQGLKYVGARVGLEGNGTFRPEDAATPRDCRTHRRRGHGDVEELPSATLGDGSGEEELVSLPGEERRFVLRRRKTAA